MSLIFASRSSLLFILPISLLTALRSAFLASTSRIKRRRCSSRAMTSSTMALSISRLTRASFTSSGLSRNNLTSNIVTSSPAPFEPDLPILPFQQPDGGNRRCARDVLAGNEACPVPHQNRNGTPYPLRCQGRGCSLPGEFSYAFPDPLFQNSYNIAHENRENTGHGVPYIAARTAF